MAHEGEVSYHFFPESQIVSELVAEVDALMWLHRNIGFNHFAPHLTDCKLNGVIGNVY